MDGERPRDLRSFSHGSTLAPRIIPMELVLQLSLLTVTVCLGTAVVFRWTVARSDTASRLGNVSPAWLSEQRRRYE
jgi:hypothetical protein